MPSKKIEPWYTEEYARERKAKIDERIAAGLDPWEPRTEEKAEKLRKKTKESAIKFRRKILKSIERLGAEGFVIQTIAELKAKIFELQNPTQDDLYKYTDAYFRDHIKIHEDTLIFFESLLKDKKKLKKTFEAYKNRLQELEEADPMIEDDDEATFVVVPPTSYPNELIIPKDKATNQLFSGELSKELTSLRMEKLGAKVQLTAKISVEVDDLKGVTLSKKINSYDRQVYEAVTSLYVDGANQFVTPLMIYRTMTGNKKADITESILKDITDSLDKCAATRVYINSRDELRGKGYKIEEPIIKENLLYIRSVQGKHNGELNEWIQILSAPVLYRYANSKNNIARLPIRLLNTPINKNKEILSAQGYLYREILWMKKDQKRKRTILYSTLYDFLEVEASTPGALRKKQSVLRKNIKERILDFWIKEKFISGYEEKKEGRTVTGVKIQL
ncbi:MAG TPA: hypothetical protein GXZ35_06540 [Acholeplasmataceae bacterium]|nr:hypothetical protein [Acholeplasmataceae bacterium]